MSAIPANLHVFCLQHSHSIVGVQEDQPKVWPNRKNISFLEKFTFSDRKRVTHRICKREEAHSLLVWPAGRKRVLSLEPVEFTSQRSIDGFKISVVFFLVFTFLFTYKLRFLYIKIKIQIIKEKKCRCRRRMKKMCRTSKCLILFMCIDFIKIILKLCI